MSIQLASVTDAAKELGISRQTLYKWIKAGVVRHRYNVNGTPVFTRWEIGWARTFAERRKAVLRRWRLPT